MIDQLYPKPDSEREFYQKEIYKTEQKMTYSIIGLIIVGGFLGCYLYLD